MSEGPHILIAEDDFEDRFIMAETFGELGHAAVIHLVEDGTKIIDYLAKNGVGDIKLIVLDLNMPRLNGTDTLRFLKDSLDYKQVPVVIFSTSVNEIEKNICMSLGAKEYITKPARYAEYVQTCKKFYLLSQEVPC